MANLATVVLGWPAFNRHIVRLTGPLQRRHSRRANLYNPGQTPDALFGLFEEGSLLSFFRIFQARKRDIQRKNIIRVESRIDL